MENLTPEYFNSDVTEKLPGLLGLNVTKIGRGSIELELEVEKKHLAGHQPRFFRFRPGTGHGAVRIRRHGDRKARYAGHLDQLKAAAGALGGMPPENEYPYDFSAVFQALPRLPILFLFNDADVQFPAHASILYERRADHFLDAECRVMVDWCLFEYLKRAIL